METYKETYDHFIEESKSLSDRLLNDMKKIIIDHHLYTLTDKEAKELEDLAYKLDDRNTEIDKKFHELCDRLHAKYKNKLVFITNIYKTI